MSPKVLNQVCYRSMSRRSNSFCIWRLLPAGGTLGMAYKSPSANRRFQILCSRRLKFDGFNYIGDPDLTPVLKC